MHVVLNISLHSNSDPSALKRFGEVLEQLQWTPLKLEHVYRARFEDQATRVGAIATARGDVRKAAVAAGIKEYQVVAQAGPDGPDSWDERHL